MWLNCQWNTCFRCFAVRPQLDRCWSVRYQLCFVAFGRVTLLSCTCACSNQMDVRIVIKKNFTLYIGLMVDPRISVVWPQLSGVDHTRVQSLTRCGHVVLAWRLWSTGDMYMKYPTVIPRRAPKAFRENKATDSVYLPFTAVKLTIAVSDRWSPRLSTCSIAENNCS